MKIKEYLTGGLFSASVVIMFFAIFYQPSPPMVLIYTPGTEIAPPLPLPLAILGYIAAFFFPGAVFSFLRKDFGKSIYLMAGILLMLTGGAIIFYKEGIILPIGFIILAIIATLIGAIGCAAGEAVRKALGK